MPTPADKASKRDAYLKKKYGITTTIYLAMLAVNKGGCWICSKKPTGLPLNVDHDHKTGQVRGLLCFFCNKFMIGRRRKEHAHLFDKAAKYLSSPIDWRTHNAKV